MTKMEARKKIRRETNTRTAQRIVQKAERMIRLLKKIAQRVQEIQPGDLYYWPKEKRLIKVMHLTAPTLVQTTIDELNLGEIQTKILCCEKKAWDGNGWNGLTHTYFVNICLEWEKVTVKDFPLYINAPIKTREFYRLLAKGE